MKMIIKILTVSLTLLLSAAIIPGIKVSGLYIAIITALMLGVVSVFIKPIIFVLTLPINILTLGLFSFVINAFLFWFVSTFIEGFEVGGFIAAILGAMIVSIGGWVAEKISNNDKSSV